jgi:VanZ family protein
MSSKARTLGFWISAWLPVVVGVCIILVESTACLGSNYTSGPFRMIYQAIFGVVNDARWAGIHGHIRKLGHFFGYGFIGLAWLRAWWMTLPQSTFIQDAVLALFGTAFIASCDEFHQTFLPNRTGTPWDVLIDCCGALTLQMAIYLLIRLLRPKKLARAA